MNLQPFHLEVQPVLKKYFVKQCCIDVAIRRSHISQTPLCKCTRICGASLQRKELRNEQVNVIDVIVLESSSCMFNIQDHDLPTLHVWLVLVLNTIYRLTILDGFQNENRNVWAHTIKEQLNKDHNNSVATLRYATFGVYSTQAFLCKCQAITGKIPATKFSFPCAVLRSMNLAYASYIESKDVVCHGTCATFTKFVVHTLSFRTFRCHRVFYCSQRTKCQPLQDEVFLSRAVL